jgi:gamma-glutamylputrescine oxidase
MEGFSIWEKETFFAPQDIVIVGSGFVGLWSAFYLKKKHPKRKITILEREIIPSGASTRNAGFACFGSLSELIRDGETMGAEKMLGIVEMRYKGLEKIRKHFTDEEIDFELCGGYEAYEENKISAEQLQQNISYLDSLLKPITGSKKTFRLVDEKIREFGLGHTEHLVENQLEGFQHSGKLVRALLQKVIGMGVQVITSAEVKDYSNQDGSILVNTDKFSLRTTKLLFCTNAFTGQLVKDLDIVPARGQVLLTSPIESLPIKGTFHSDEGYYYFRNLGNRLLLGGARNKAFDEEETLEVTTSQKIQAELENFLDSVVLPNFKGRYQIEDRWAGIMCMGSEKSPIIKQLEENVYCAIRMSGIGVAIAPVVAQQVSTLMH